MKKIILFIGFSFSVLLGYSQITQLEYFWDIDPGFGNASQLSFTPGTTVISNFTIDISSLSPGIHSMFLRAKDDDGSWSLYTKHNIFVISGISATPNITQLEYFWDVDPGIGLANPLPCSPPAQTIQQDFQISLASLAIGDHYLYIRAKDDYGRWSLYSKDTVSISDQLPSNISVQNVTINNSQAECYNAADTITVAGSGTMVDILLGGEAIFIAGKRIHFKPGFNAYPGSYVNAYITITGEYCGSQQSMMAANENTLDIEQDDGNLSEITNYKQNVKIYPNPTSGITTIDFMGTTTQADIQILNFQGQQMLELEYNNQNKVKLNISSLPVGMYIIVIKTQTQIITRKIIRAGS